LSPRLLSTLAVLEHKEGKVSPQSFPAVTAASKFGGPITVFLAGSGSEKAAEQAAKLNGVEKVIYTSNNAYDKVLSLPPTFELRLHLSSSEANIRTHNRP